MINSKLSREIECLTRLQALTNQVTDIVMFLKQEGLVTDNQIKSLQHTPEFAKEVQAMLRDLQVRQKLQMLQYEWNILPIENIDIHIITDRESRNFTYNG